MRINYLKKYISREYLKKFEKENIRELYPPQEEAIKKGIFEGRNLVISTPTASGKTFIATLAIIRTLNINKKVIYIVPLVALASEKYHYYKEFFKENFKVALSVGDLDSQDPWLKHYQLIITTSEKFDSLLRHGIDWLGEAGLVIIDEIHLLNDNARGPTLEILITILKKNLPKAQFLGLSATITNAQELADWLKADVIKSDFRPVKLYEGVCLNPRLYFLEKKSLVLENLSIEEAITKDTIKKRNKQLLIFVSTRRIAESLTERLARLVGRYLKEEEKNHLKKLSEDILKALSTPTRQCKKLADVVKKAVAFHHAGLLSKQKSLIEENFRKGLIKVVCCTPTLALGVNLPAFRVLIRDIKRYYPGLGSLEIPVLEYKQFAGRAGRPQYDRFGEAVIIAKSKDDKDRLIKKYILGKPERIESKLSQEKSLRIHSLALIASEIAFSLEGLLDFFTLTFFGFQYKDLSFLKNKLTKILYDLESWNFIQRKENNLLEATFLGRRVSSLYIDPKSANFLIEALRLAKDLGISEFGILQVLCYCDEIQPSLNVRAKDLELLQDTINLYKDKILMDVPLLWDENYEDFLKSIKTALCFFSWINEAEEARLFEEFQITPGELHNKLEIIDWLVYSLTEIAKILKFKEFCSFLNKLRWRLNYGVKEELLELVSLPEIGRVRARRLFEAGIKDIFHLKKASFKTVKEILGEKIALKVLEGVK